MLLFTSYNYEMWMNASICEPEYKWISYNYKIIYNRG